MNIEQSSYVTHAGHWLVAIGWLVRVLTFTAKRVRALPCQRSCFHPLIWFPNAPHCTNAIRQGGAQNCNPQISVKHCTLHCNAMWCNNNHKFHVSQDMWGNLRIPKDAKEDGEKWAQFPNVPVFLPFPYVALLKLQMRQQQSRNIGEWQFQNCNAVFIHKTKCIGATD